MNESDDIAARIMASIAALPIAEQRDVVHSFVSSVLQQLPVGVIHEMRAEIASQFDPTLNVVSTTLDLIDGALALREMGLTDTP